MSEYTIKANGREVTRTASTQLDVATTLGREAKYEIVADPDLSAAQITEDTITRYSYGVEVTPATTDVSEATNDSQPGDTLPAGIPYMTTSRTTYEAYIPTQYINAPDTGTGFDCESGDGSDYWYSGDNRSTGYETGKYRTKAAINNYWTNAFTFTSKGVSPTHRYKRLSNGAMVYDSTRTASGDLFRIFPVSNDGRKSIVRIGHIVGNPYCSSMNTIDYNNEQELYSNGGHMISGGHDRMPNHQFYRYDKYSDGTAKRSLIFDHRLMSPLCLNPLFCDGERRYQYAK